MAITIFIGGGGNPNLFELFGSIVAILLVVLIINYLIDWLGKKPWKRGDNIAPPTVHQSIQKENTNQNEPDSDHAPDNLLFKF